MDGRIDDAAVTGDDAPAGARRDGQSAGTAAASDGPSAPTQAAHARPTVFLSLTKPDRRLFRPLRAVLKCYRLRPAPDRVDAAIGKDPESPAPCAKSVAVLLAVLIDEAARPEELVARVKDANGCPVLAWAATAVRPEAEAQPLVELKRLAKEVLEAHPGQPRRRDLHKLASRVAREAGREELPGLGRCLVCDAQLAYYKLRNYLRVGIVLIVIGLAADLVGLRTHFFPPSGPPALSLQVLDPAWSGGPVRSNPYLPRAGMNADGSPAFVAVDPWKPRTKAWHAYVVLFHPDGQVQVGRVDDLQDQVKFPLTSPGMHTALVVALKRVLTADEEAALKKRVAAVGVPPPLAEELHLDYTRDGVTTFKSAYQGRGDEIEALVVPHLQWSNRLREDILDELGGQSVQLVGESFLAKPAGGG